MNKLNKIIILFLTFFALAVYATWKFIHSEKFSKQISNQVSSILSKKLNTTLVFKTVDFQLFPPATLFHDVSVKWEGKDVWVDLELKTIGVFFTYKSFLSSDLKIDEVEGFGGHVKIIDNSKKNNDWDLKKIKINELHKKYIDLYHKMPLKLSRIAMEGVKLDYNNEKSFLKKIELDLTKENLKLNANVNNLILDKNYYVNEFLFDAVLNKKEIKIKKINLSTNNQKLSGDIQFFDFNKTVNCDGILFIKSNLKKIRSEIPYVEFILDKNKLSYFEKISGEIEASINLKQSIIDPNIKVMFNLSHFAVPFIELDRISGVVLKEQSQVFLEKINIENKNEKYSIKNKVAIWNIVKNEFANGTIPVMLQNAKTNTFLYALKSLKILDASISGMVNVVFHDKGIDFIVPNQLVIDYLKLGKILNNKKFILHKSSFSLDKKFDLNVHLNLQHSFTNILAEGEITSDSVDINIKNSKVNLAEIGPVSGLNIKGKGDLDLRIAGPMEDVSLTFDAKLENVSFLDLNLGNVRSKFTYFLKKNILDFQGLDGKYNETEYHATGDFKFDEKKPMDLNLNFNQANISDLKNMYPLVFSKINIPSWLLANFKYQLLISGGFDLDQLKILGELSDGSISVFNESFNFKSIKWNLKNKQMEVAEAKLQKGNGEIRFDYSLNLENNYMEILGSSKSLHLNDFANYKQLHLEYDGNLGLEFDGNGIGEDFTSRIKSEVSSAFIKNIPATDSFLTLYLKKDELSATISALSNQLKSNIQWNWKNESLKGNSFLDIKNGREFLGVFAAKNISDKSIQANIKAHSEFDFNYRDWQFKKITLDISDFIFKKNDIDVRLNHLKNKIVVEKGIVKVWDVKFTDGDYYFLSKAKQLSEGGIKLEQSFLVRSSVMELFSDYIDKTNGAISGIAEAIFNQGLTVKKFEIQGVNNSLKVKDLPGSFTNVDFNLIKDGNEFRFSKCKGLYGGGDFVVDGSAKFDNLFPSIKLNYSISRANLPILKKSKILFSSQGQVSGNLFPYDLKGDVQILHAEILEDPQDLMQGKYNKNIGTDEYSVYLPQSKKFGLVNKEIINLNMDVMSNENIYIKNNLAEVKSSLNANFSGDIFQPNITAKITVAPAVSKFKFKGHDFFLNQGFLDYQLVNKISNSEVKFVGSAKINQYDVKIDIGGSIDKIVYGLSSEPNLSKSDLLSLLTLGVTNEMSKSMDQVDRKSVTSLGVGSILVDQLKINEDLNSELGLKVSVLPDFKSDDSSLVQGKSAVGDTAATKLKSSTKIKVNKNISNKVDVSVSSTVGNATDQKQEMNINYNINKNISIEGVYEVRPADEINTNTPNSLGADLKYHWSF